MSTEVSSPELRDSQVTIGVLARQAGVNASAIRFYEREGLLPEPERAGRQRRYGPEAARRLQVIDIAKQAGFTLAEIRVLLETADAGDVHDGRLRELAENKLAEVEALIARAEAMREWLERAQTCRCSSLELCGLFDQGL